MRPLLLAAILTLVVAPLHAQGGRMGGRGEMGGGRPGMQRRRPADMPGQDIIRGPIAPDSLAPKFRLDTLQAARYRSSWDSMMAATRSARDSIHEAMEVFQRARTEGYQREGQRQLTVVQHLGKELKKEDKRFDKVIRVILSKEQWEEFKDWRDRRRQTEQELRQEREQEGGGMGRRGEGRRPGGPGTMPARGWPREP